jgi:hypothetical protein
MFISTQRPKWRSSLEFPRNSKLERAKSLSSSWLPSWDAIARRLHICEQLDAGVVDIHACTRFVGGPNAAWRRALMREAIEDPRGREAFLDTQADRDALDASSLAPLNVSVPRCRRDRAPDRACAA